MKCCKTKNIYITIHLVFVLHLVLVSVMQNMMATYYYICLSVLFIILFQQTTTVYGKRYSKPVPKIVLVNGHEIDRDLNSNITYELNVDQIRVVTLSCISETPNFWRWKLEKNPRQKQITKERIQETNVSKKSHYVSNITVNWMFDASDSHRISYACLDSDSVKSKNKRISCAIFRKFDLHHKLPRLYLFYKLTIENCLQTNDVQHKDKSSHGSSNCSADLVLDLNESRGACLKRDSNTTIESVECSDLDTCDNIEFNHKLSHNPYACNKRRFESISPNISDYSDSAALKHNITLPLHVYCKRTIDNAWTSFVTIYPGFHSLGKFWSEMAYYQTVGEARLHSMQLFALPYGHQHFKNSNMRNQNQYKREKFAVGETVTFVCIGIRYFFMTGFEWMINKIPYYHDDLDESVDKSSFPEFVHYYVHTKQILMNETKHGNFFQISCRAPIWNSITFTTFTKNVSLYPAENPKASLKCKENSTAVICSCVYHGWPQPILTWNSSSFLNLHKTEEKLEDGDDDDSIRPRKPKWTRISIYTKPQNASPTRQVVVTCSVVNFMGKYTSTYKTEKTSKESAEEHNWPLIIGITVPIVLLTVFVAVAFYLRHIKKQRFLKKHKLNYFLNGGGKSRDSNQQNECVNDGLEFQFPSVYKISKRNVELGSIIGSGEFGMVRKGILSDQSEVAVKIPKSSGDAHIFASALAELKILCYIGSHSHVVSLIGAYVGEIMIGKLYIIMEYCENGSLVNYLRHLQTMQHSENEQACVNLYDFCKFSHEIACGMEYVAEKRVVHGDLAARNVLLTDGYSCKIADFGLSRKLYAYSEYVKKSHEPLPWRWMAPESLKNMVFTTKSDMWSYGVTVWEIYSLGMQPYPGLSWSNGFVNELDNGMRLEKPPHCSDDVYVKLTECFHQTPEERPTFGEMVNFFVNLRETAYMSLKEE